MADSWETVFDGLCEHWHDSDISQLRAALYRCEWLDEAEKWASTPVNDCKNFDDIAGWKAEAEAIAEQWRKWGRGEPWE